MLHLQSTSSELWWARVCENVEELLIDHAHCEKKAAGVAMNLMFAYVEEPDIRMAMTDIVQEELSHFHLVLDLLDQRGIRFRRIRPSVYGEKLHVLVNKLEPQRAVDRFLVAGLIEARSCERFGVLRDRLEDRALAEFFGGLYAAEARHHATYVRLAGLFQPEARVMARLEELAKAEARIIAEGDERPRMHG